MSALEPTSWLPLSGRARLALASLLLLSLSGCGNAPEAAKQTPTEEGAPPSPSSVEEKIGTLAFELRTVENITLNRFDYAITGPNFSKAGSIDVSNSNTVSARIDGIPANSGYSVTVLGNSVDAPITQCTGSAAFEILARSVQNVPIAISCRVQNGAPPVVVAAPLPPFSGALCGLVLLGLGATLASRSRSKAML
jgi:hypothetical protein